MMGDYGVQQGGGTSDHMGEAEVMVDYRVEQGLQTSDHMGEGLNVSIWRVPQQTSTKMPDDCGKHYKP